MVRAQKKARARGSCIVVGRWDVVARVIVADAAEYGGCDGRACFEFWRAGVNDVVDCRAARNCERVDGLGLALLGIYEGEVGEERQ